MSTNKKAILLDDINNKRYTLFVPPDDYDKIHEGKVQVSDTQPVDLEKLNASSIEKQIPLPTTNNCLQESVIDLTEPSQHDQENASTLEDSNLFFF
ncbi:hypothetical protein WA026_004254 [Henosepilachna vigintioctopunctata]|uniref:Uncharacterized protein n=1 Tax=Henosepilachna vigintioctopunctata TaxID=420089 RepID=A0AAW1V2T6_9CUCU